MVRHINCLGIIETDIHLIGPVNKGDPMYLLGADRLGRDMLSRTSMEHRFR